MAVAAIVVGVPCAAALLGTRPPTGADLHRPPVYRQVLVHAVLTPDKLPRSHCIVHRSAGHHYAFCTNAVRSNSAEIAGLVGGGSPGSHRQQRHQAR